MKSITLSSPLQLVGIDFLRSDPCSEGYEYLLVITDHLQGFPKYTQQQAHVQKRQLRSYTTILLCVMVFLRNY